MSEQFATVVITPRNPDAWLLQSKDGTMQAKLSRSKPSKFNKEIFDLKPLYEIKKVIKND